MLEQNGVLMVNCKVCGPNLSHTTGFHKEWNRNRANFTLPDTHPYVKAKALVAGTQTPPTCPPAPAPTTTPAPAPSANPDTLTFSRRDLEAKINRAERNSTDPNASAMASMMREMLLN